MRSGAAPHDDALARSAESLPCGVCFAFRKLAERAAPVLQACAHRVGIPVSGVLLLLGTKTAN